MLLKKLVIYLANKLVLHGVPWLELLLLGYFLRIDSKQIRLPNPQSGSLM